MRRNVFRFQFEGESHEVRVDFTDEMHSYVRRLSHAVPPIEEYERFIADDPYGEHILGLVIDPFASHWGNMSDRTTLLRFCLAFCQSVPYANERGEYPRYPSETIMDGHGDCEDSAILFGMFARALDYECAFLLVGRSGFLGIGGWCHLDVGLVPSYPGEFSGQYYEFEGRPYYYCSCNGPGRPIGEIPAEFATPARILPIRVDVGGEDPHPGPHRHDDLWFCVNCAHFEIGWHPNFCPRCNDRRGQWRYGSSSAFCPNCGDVNPGVAYLEDGCPACGYRAGGPEELGRLLLGT